VLTEELSGAPDEGRKKFALALPYAWEAVASRLLDQVLPTRSANARTRQEETRA
jgi:hypothetical protein